MLNGPRGFEIDMFCMSLMKEENRNAFKANEKDRRVDHGSGNGPAIGHTEINVRKIVVLDL
jgi:hypothetical protein